jgi:Polyketide cyclase / dehydrase and lipid transport
MKRQNVRVAAQTDATPEVVYGLLADGSTWTAWSPMDRVELEREGNPPPEGPGAIRVHGKGRRTGRDEILALEPGRRYQYKSLSGVPVRDYVGEVTLERTPSGGTAIDWHSTFFPTTPPGTGWLVERGIRRFLAQCANGLAVYAAAQPAARDAAEC